MMLIWGLGSLLLIGLLGLQYVIFNLDSLLKDPEKAAKIHSLCAIVSCDLPIANVSMLKTETLNLAKGTTAAAIGRDFYNYQYDRQKNDLSKSKN